MKSLVLAEKPSVARDIARVLGCHKNISGAIEGSNYIVTWALGHLITLADPEEYDKKFDNIDMQFKSINYRFDMLLKELKNDFKKIEEKFDEIDDRFDEIDERFDSMNVNVVFS